jgi:hypothetical protein
MRQWGRLRIQQEIEAVQTNYRSGNLWILTRAKLKYCTYCSTNLIGFCLFIQPPRLADAFAARILVFGGA